MTVDPFTDFERPHMARGHLMYRGMAVVISNNVPKDHVADELIPVMPSQLYCFLYWLITHRMPLPVRYRAGQRIEEDQIFQMSGKLFMLPETWEKLQRRAA